MLEIKEVSFRYNESSLDILKDINLSANKGEVIGIVGLSGSGKSTFMSIINGLIPKRISGVLKGSVYINKQDISKLSLSELTPIVGTVFQDPDNQLFFSTVKDELAFGLENMCYEKEKIQERINEVTSLLKIKQLLNRNPNELSGGEKQLVVIAAILCLGVKLLILDECMTQVDMEGRKLILSTIKHLKDNNTTIIMVEHEYDNLHHADRVFIIENKTLRQVKREDLV